MEGLPHMLLRIIIDGFKFKIFLLPSTVQWDDNLLWGYWSLLMCIRADKRKVLRNSIMLTQPHGLPSMESSETCSSYSTTLADNSFS